MNEITVKSLFPPEINKKEILRYAKSPTSSEEISALLDEVISACRDVFEYKVCYTLLSVETCGEICDFGDFKIKSRDLSKFLKENKKVMLFAATLGVGIDRLINKYSRISPAKALLIDAFATERIEALCDAFLLESGINSSRFSPGYGDLPLCAQREIFSVLKCEKNIGLTLNESLTMSPAKSVTALTGIG